MDGAGIGGSTWNLHRRNQKPCLRLTAGLARGLLHTSRQVANKRAPPFAPFLETEAHQAFHHLRDTQFAGQLEVLAF